MYTPTYIARITAQLRGALRATSVPVSVSSLVNKAIASDDHGGALFLSLSRPLHKQRGFKHQIREGGLVDSAENLLKSCEPRFEPRPRFLEGK